MSATPLVRALFIDKPMETMDTEMLEDPQEEDNSTPTEMPQNKEKRNQEIDAHTNNFEKEDNRKQRIKETIKDTPKPTNQSNQTSPQKRKQ